MKYVTVQGDTWDIIAYKTYGNELLADKIMAANRELLGIFVFSAGTTVIIPEVEEEDDSELPPWRY